MMYAAIILLLLLVTYWGGLWAFVVTVILFAVVLSALTPRP